MTALFSIDPTRFLQEQLGSASPDLLRQMLTTFHEHADVRRGRRGLRGTVWRVQPGAHQRAQRVSASGVRKPRRHPGGEAPVSRWSGRRFIVSAILARAWRDRAGLTPIPFS